MATSNPPPSATLIPLLLMGGASTRMSTPKALLPFPDGLPSFHHTLSTICSAIPAQGPSASSHSGPSLLPSLPTPLLISLRDMRQYALLNASVTAMQQSQGRPPAMDLQEQLAELYNRPMTLVFDSAVEIGPAAGLLAAHALFPDASLLVVGCDYPLLTREAVGQLVAAHFNSDVTAPTTTTTTTTTPPVTCFINSAGFGEPLIAIWGTEALDALKTNVKVEGMSGLLRVVKEVGGQMVRPKEEEWIRGVNTKEEWEEVRGVLAERMGLRLELDGVVMGQGGSTEEGVVNMV